MASESSSLVRQLSIALALVSAVAVILGWILFSGNDVELPGGNGAREQVTGGPETGTSNTGTDNPVGPDTDTQETGDTRMMVVSGRVIDVNTGFSLPSVTVSLSDPDSGRRTPIEYVRTREEGTFLVEIPEHSRLRLTARAIGYASATWIWSDGYQLDPDAHIVGGSNDLLLSLAPESALWVLADVPDLMADESLLADCRCLQTRTRHELGDFLNTTPRKLENSECRFGSLSAGRYLVTLRTHSRVLGRREIELGEGEEVEVSFDIGPPIEVTGIARENGIQVVGGMLSIWSQDDQSSSTSLIGDDGFFMARLSQPGRYTFTYSPGDGTGAGSSVVIFIEGNESLDLDFRSGRISGRVLGALGGPIGGMSGSIFGPRSYNFVTDEEGRFEINDVAFGSYRWVFLNTPAATFAPTRTLAVDGDVVAEYRFESAGLIEVRATRDDGGLPSSDVGRPQVYLLEPYGSLSLLKRSDRDRYYFWPSSGGLGVVYKRGWVPYFFQTGPTSSPPRIDAILTPAGEVTVTVVGPDGNLLGGQEFVIEPLEGQNYPPEWLRRRTGPRGTSRVTLDAGNYEVQTVLPGGESVRRSFTVVLHQSTEARLP